MARSETGASLAGLLVVVLILGVMAAVAVAGTSMLTPSGAGLPVVTFPASPTTTSPTIAASGQMTAIGLARQAACRADYESVVTADEMVFDQTGFYSDTVAQLVADGYLHAAPSSTHGYTIGLAYAPAGQGHGRDHGASNGGRDPTGDVTVSGRTSACDHL